MWVGFKASFLSLAEGNFEATFEFSHSHTFSESMNKGTTKSYKFTLQVPPNSTYIAKGMVQEADMEVPCIWIGVWFWRKEEVSVWNMESCSEYSYIRNWWIPEPVIPELCNVWQILIGIVVCIEPAWLLYIIGIGCLVFWKFYLISIGCFNDLFLISESV